MERIRQHYIANYLAHIAAKLAEKPVNTAFYFF